MLHIERWEPGHSRWPEYEAFLRAAGDFRVYERLAVEESLSAAVFLAGLWDERLAGSLIFLKQPIGPEMDVPVIHDAAGKPLYEAKIRAFYVLEPLRNRGIGTGLQRAALRLAVEMGCYQVRSRSELDKSANYAVKMKLGFAMHPAERVFRDGRRSPGVYWVKKV